MQDAAMLRRFKGAVQLVTLHLWRVGKTTDIDTCIGCAKDLGMIDADDEAFIRKCISMNEDLDSTDTADTTGASVATDIDDDLIHDLQMCAIRLNSADPA